MDVGAQQRVVAVGASAGGVKALIRLAAALPRDLGHAVMVLHIPAEAPPSQLARILDRSGPLPAVWAAHGDLIETGRTGRFATIPPRQIVQQVVPVHGVSKYASKVASHIDMF